MTQIERIYADGENEKLKIKNEELSRAEVRIFLIWMEQEGRLNLDEWMNG